MRSGEILETRNGKVAVLNMLIKSHSVKESLNFDV